MRNDRRGNSALLRPCRVKILGETEHLIAVSKPAGLLIHPTKPGGPRTLWDELCDLLSFERVNGGQVSLINRLDRETSGVVLAAKTPSAARECAMAMAAGRVQKRYAAIVRGSPLEDVFEVDAPLIRAGEVGESAVWLRRGVHPKGAAAKTRFEVRGRWSHPVIGPLAEIAAYPLTGRTHQIRVHLSHVGLPVVGDKIYGDSELLYLEFIRTGWTAALEKRLFLDRHALHSEWLALEYLGEKLEWQAPLPDDMKGLLPRPEDGEAGFRDCGPAVRR